MEYKKVSNPRSTNTGKYIDCDVVFPSISKRPVPFTATPDDSSEHGQEIYKGALSGQFGDIQIAPNETDWFWNGKKYVEMQIGDVSYQNEEIKTRLIRTATEQISILTDAVDLGDASDTELTSLTEWKKFRINVNRIDTTTSGIKWPDKPV
ncbi:tail fiber assembly protein [Serratia quinivorans]